MSNKGGRVSPDYLADIAPEYADIPLEILRRYAEHPACQKKNRLLPVPCNQKMNSYLKEIADLCLINKTLTTHVAHHTYATFWLSQGVSLKNVSSMLGHASVKMTERYARVLDSSILRDMNAIRDTLNLGNRAEVADSE